MIEFSFAWMFIGVEIAKKKKTWFNIRRQKNINLRTPWTVRSAIEG
jgi:hypothetical protein